METQLWYNIMNVEFYTMPIIQIHQVMNNGWLAKSPGCQGIPDALRTQEAVTRDCAVLLQNKGPYLNMFGERYPVRGIEEYAVPKGSGSLPSRVLGLLSSLETTILGTDLSFLLWVAL